MDKYTTNIRGIVRKMGFRDKYTRRKIDKKEKTLPPSLQGIPKMKLVKYLRHLSVDYLRGSLPR